MCCTIYCVYVTPLACCFLFFFNRSSSFGTFSLSLHDALPIYFFFVPDMVARGEDIDAPIEEFICDFGSHSKTRRGVLAIQRSEEHTSELQSHHDLVCRLLLEKKKDAYINDLLFYLVMMMITTE